VFGAVASPATCWRALDEIGQAQLRGIAKARARVRARVWTLMGQLPAARAAGRDIGTDAGNGVVVLDVDSTLVIAHSDKEGAAATYKHTFGFHPILVTCDNTGELLAITLRPGNAGANTAADHLQVLAEALAQVPAAHRRHLLIRGDLGRRHPRGPGLAHRTGPQAGPHRGVLDRLVDRLVDRRGGTRGDHRATGGGLVCGVGRRRRRARGRRRR
jgi:hypothetical protein